jgi:glucose/arabinose dehydrogenase
MKRHIALLFLGAVLMPLSASAQTAPSAPPHPTPDTPAANSGLPRTPTYLAVEGQPIDSRAPEKKGDQPLFAQQTRAPYHHPTDFWIDEMTGALHAPWAAAVLPDGAVLVTERLPGAFRIVGKDGSLSAPLAGLDQLHVTTPQTGLLDVVPDRDFARNNTIYFTYFTYDEKIVGNTAIARAVLDRKAGALRDVKVLMQTLPLFPNDTTLAAGTKSGGRIAQDRDGNLYVCIGDRDNAGTRPWGVAQVLDTHLGKVIRITRDGAPASGNPFAGRTIAEPGIKALPEIWAYGLRSPEGLAFAPNGDLYEVEHGPRGGDELNLIRRGANYGWPVISHGIDYRGQPVGDGASARPGMEQPVYYWSPSTAPSGLAFYTGGNPAWKDSVFVGMLNGRMLSRLTLKDGKVVNEEAMLTGLKSRIRDVRTGPDGAVYVLTDSGGAAISDNTPPTSKLLRLTPR